MVVLKKIHTSSNVNTSQKPGPVTIEKKRIKTSSNRACFNILSSRTTKDDLITEARMCINSKFFSFAESWWNSIPTEWILRSRAVAINKVVIYFVLRLKRKTQIHDALQLYIFQLLTTIARSVHFFYRYRTKNDTKIRLFKNI